MAKKPSLTSAPVAKKSPKKTLGVKSIVIPPLAGAEFHYVSISAPVSTTTATTSVTVGCRCTVGTPTFVVTVTEQQATETEKSAAVGIAGITCGTPFNVSTPTVGMFYVVSVTMTCNGVQFSDQAVIERK